MKRTKEQFYEQFDQVIRSTPPSDKLIILGDFNDRVRQRDIRDVRLTRAMRGAECWTDHRLVRTVLLLHIARPHRKHPKTVRASYNVAGLGNPFRLSKFQVWFDENDEKIKDVFHIKNKAFIEWQNDPSSVYKRDKFKTLQAKVQSELRQMQDKWWEVKAAQVQLYADTHNAKKFFSSLKTVFGPSASGCSPLLSSDGSTLIKDQEGLSKPWQEHFSNLLNRPSSVDADALNQIPQ